MITDKELHDIFMSNFDSYAGYAGDDGEPVVPTMSEKRFIEVMVKIKELNTIRRCKNEY